MMDTYKNFIEDSLETLIVRAEQNKKAAIDSDFHKGIDTAYCEILNHLLDQAELWGIKKSFKKSVRNYTPYLS